VGTPERGCLMVFQPRTVTAALVVALVFASAYSYVNLPIRGDNGGSPATPSVGDGPETNVITIPRSRDEAAKLFGGPPAGDWEPCPEPDRGCWHFVDAGESYTVRVQQYCLRDDGSIDGWRLRGGHPERPDGMAGEFSTWYGLEAATIRCRED
jgi:hypothetical protein